MSTQNDFGQCPWVGPLPCEEWHGTRFFGRTRELKELFPKIRTQNLTVISAESGAGKTSLINAGLIPALRLGRERAPNIIGFTLCVRKWGGVITKSKDLTTPKNAAQVMIEAITESLNELRKDASAYPGLLGVARLQQDLEMLSAVKSPDRNGYGDWEKDLEILKTYLQCLRDAVLGGNLIIVADQAEEFMGSGMPSAGLHPQVRALNVFESIIHLDAVRLVISLREEYMGKLRPLEDLCHPLAPRVYHLSPLTWGGAREVIKLSTDEETDVNIDVAEVNRVLEWASSPLDHSKEEQRDLLPVDMLAVQAFLVDLYRREKKSDRKKREEHTPHLQLKMDAEYLEAYMVELLREEPQLKVQGTYLAAGPMLRWIDNAFDTLDTEKGILTKRIAANMGTVLSTPKGFKSHTTEGDLVYHAIRKDLPMSAEEAIDMLAVRHALAEGKRLEKESFPRRAVEISEAGFDAIKCLLKGNILKKYGTDFHGTPIYSLQHDGYAPAFIHWCEDAGRRQNDCLAPKVGSYGIQIRRTTLLEKVSKKMLDYEDSEIRTVKTRNLVFDDLKELVWEGCDIRDVKIRNINFEDCKFTGSFVLDCEFERCHFSHCTFNGTFFLRGTFKEVTFTDKCEMKGLVAKSMDWQNVKFISTDLTSAVIQHVVLTGALEMDSCDALYAQIYKFDVKNSQDKLDIIARGCNLHGALFENYDKEDRKRFINCTNTTEYTTLAPKESEAGLA